jgi:hypothetical protein
VVAVSLCLASSGNHKIKSKSLLPSKGGIKCLEKFCLQAGLETRSQLQGNADADDRGHSDDDKMGRRRQQTTNQEGVAVAACDILLTAGGQRRTQTASARPGDEGHVL